MAREYLDRVNEEEVAEAVINAFDHMPPEEVIPGLVLAIKELAHSVDVDDRAEVLEEASNLLADD